MKIQHLILLLSILVVTSCKEITKVDIQGNWIAMRTGNDEVVIRELHFKNETVEVIGKDVFKESGEYQIKNRKIKIKLDRDDIAIEIKIQKLGVDTFLIFDNLMYQRNRMYTSMNVQEYELIGISTNKYLSSERNDFHVIHFYKSKKGAIRIRYGDKNATFEDIFLFLERRHSKRGVLIYLGKGINLQDIKKLYYRLASIYQLKVWFATKKEGLSRTHIFADNIQIWRVDLENYIADSSILQPIPPPPPYELTSKAIYLKDRGKELEILNRKDFGKIQKMDANTRYVISISSHLTIEDYFELKRRIREKRKINKQIITDIE